MSDLVDSHLPLARKLAWKKPIVYGVMDRDDVHQDAVVGLLRARDSFDRDAGAAFASYAHQRITGEIADGQRRLDHVPRSFRRQERAAAQAREQLQAELGREPTATEVASRIGVSTQELRDAEERCAPPTSLDERLAVQFDTDLDVVGTIEDPGPEPAELAELHETRDRLHDALGELPAHEQFAVRGRWLLGEKNVDIAAALGVSESRISQLQRAGLDRLACALA